MSNQSSKPTEEKISNITSAAKRITNITAKTNREMEKMKRKIIAIRSLETVILLRSTDPPLSDPGTSIF